MAVFGVSAGTGAGAGSHVFANAAGSERQPATGTASIAGSFLTDSAPSNEVRLTALVLARSKPQIAAAIAPSPSGRTSKRARKAVAALRPATAAAPASAPAAPASSVVAAPGNSAGYAFGYCTWWVSHKRFIPWHGLAYQWWSMARAYGFAEGSTPRVGAVMVMAAGIAGASASSGHVAYVEAVNPDGSFKISEMNWYGAGGGWGKVDYRTITSMRGILGFIY